MQRIGKWSAFGASLVLGSSGCFDLAQAPAAAQAREPDPAPVPPLVHVQVPASAELMQRWALPASNPWFRWFKFTLLTAVDDHPVDADLPDVRALESVARAECAAERLARDGWPDGTLLLADLRGAASVRFGATLSDRAADPISLVLTFNNWPADNELIPAEETLAALVSASPRLPDPWSQSARPVFLLDSWRLAYRDEEPNEAYVDNRYMLNAADLPDADTLKQHGIRQVMYVVDDRGRTGVEEDDLHDRFLEWQQAGIAISLVDLYGLCSDPVTPEQLCVEDRYVVVPRMTIVGSAPFFSRAHGGFGGPLAVPAPVGGRTIHGSGGVGWGGFGG